MRFSILSDIPGRLRVRCGCLSFSADEARGISVALLRVEGVKSAEAHEANGTILVLHNPAAREGVLAAIKNMDLLALPSLPQDSIEVPNSLEAAFENARFARKIASLVFWHFVRRIVLPAPVRAVVTIVQAASFIWHGLRDLAHGTITVNVLDATALAVCIARGSFTNASSTMLLLSMTGALEEHVQRRSHIALAENLICRPETVWQHVDGADRQIPIKDIAEGMLLHLRQGQVLPIDGVVESGEGELNEASMTGEAALVRKDAGVSVYAGTALETGDLIVRVTAIPGKSHIDEIAAMVEDSFFAKAGVQSRAEHLADALVPFSFAAFFGIWGISRSLVKAMTVLMVDYSCAVRVATPVSVVAATGEASKRGMVIKGGKYLEALADADTVVFDKTGTLTNASPVLEKIIVLGDLDEDEILRLAACIEEHFPHSIARAIVDAAEKRGITHVNEPHTEVHYVVAHGIKTSIDGREACIGSAHFIFDDEKVKKPRGIVKRIEKKAPGASIIYLAIDGVLEGALCISDPIRPEAARVMQALRETGIEHIVMLTGDSEQAASCVAMQLGIDEYHAQVLPEDKSTYVQRLRAKGRIVCMVGDGINDSPALATADVSIALADASDIARAVADVCITDSSLEKLVTAREISMRLMKRIQRDYRFIVGFNSTLIVVGVAGIITASTASLLHNMATLGIAATSARPLLPKGE